MTKKEKIIYWIIQIVLAVLFMIFGVKELFLPIDRLAAQVPLPAVFIRIIGTLEILGAFGLVVPAVFKRYAILTSLAAWGLVILMIGATVVVYATDGPIASLFPFLTGIFCASVSVGHFPKTA